MRQGVMVWLAARRWMVDLAIAFSGTVAVALLGLVIQDILPGPGQHGGSTPARWLWTVFWLGVLGGSVYLRWTLTGGYGTLFYVQHLAADMPNWHLARVRQEARGYLDVRMMFRGFPAQSAGAFVDLAEDVDRLSRDLQSEFNADRVDSGFTIAPNIVAPCAMALGSSFSWWPGTRMLEFMGPHSMSWRPPDEWPLDDSSFCGAKVVIGRPQEAGGQRHHLMLVVLTGQGPATRPPGSFRLESTVDLRQGDVGPLQVTMEQDPDPASGHVDTVGATVVLATAMREALHELPEAEFLVLVARLPKTVALAVGRLIVDRRCSTPQCSRPACRDPWSRLIVPYWDAATQSYVWPRVHRSQPELTRLREALG